MNPLAVVLDTNVIVAAMRSRQGCSFKIIDADRVAGPIVPDRYRERHERLQTLAKLTP
jgi:hypothetical protein